MPFKPGQSGNPAGRPKKGQSLTDLMKEVLEEPASDDSPISRKEALVRKVLNEAFNGNDSMVKLAWNYVDGMPVQRSILAGDEDAPIKVDIEETLNKIYGSPKKVPTDSKE